MGEKGKRWITAIGIIFNILFGLLIMSYRILGFIGGDGWVPYWFCLIEKRRKENGEFRWDVSDCSYNTTFHDKKEAKKYAKAENISAASNRIYYRASRIF